MCIKLLYGLQANIHGKGVQIGGWEGEGDQIYRMNEEEITLKVKNFHSRTPRFVYVYSDPRQININPNQRLGKFISPQPVTSIYAINVRKYITHYARVARVMSSGNVLLSFFK